MKPEDEDEVPGREAENLPAVIEAEIVDPAVPAEPEAPRRDLLAAALRSLKSVNTRKAYESHWRRFAAFFDQAPGDFIYHLMQMHKADALDMVHEFAEHLQDEGKAVSTIAAHLRAIVSMIDRWYRAEVFPWTLKGLVNVPTPSQYTDVTGTHPDAVRDMLLVTKSLGTSVSKRDHAILLLLHDSGLRARELYTLDMVHWFPERREVRVWPKGKARGIRVAQPVSPRTQRALETWLEVRGDRPGPLFCRLPIDDPPRPLDKDLLLRIVQRAARVAGVTETVSPHRLRHAGITFLARKGVAPNELREFARHASFDTTLIYIRNAEGAVRSLVEVFEDEDLDDQ